MVNPSDIWIISVQDKNEEEWLKIIDEDSDFIHEEIMTYRCQSQYILTKITDHSTNKIVFHYTPDYENIQTESNVFNGSEVLFVKSASNEEFPLHIKHPIMSQA